ncbi:hypothetical protein [Aquimarina mytili]|uniref:Uncharacterized protein n=1 Tax=Aquimarina mytili TaxID=874423 RepID=A0A937A2X4_9FLAO|nr:hypothetical protein [Aquimarina mytili]MBL0683975.1 hypothetical protein [Aquimarina mytili]
MKHVFFMMLVILYVAPIISQKTVAYSDIALKSKRDAVPLVNNQSNELSLFIADRKKLFLKKYNQEFKLSKEQVFKRPTSNLKNIIEGVYGLENQYLFLLSNNSKKRFELLKVDAQQNSVTSIRDYLNYNEDEYLQTFKIKNQIYVMTIGKNQSYLNIHKINTNGSLEKRKYDLSSEEFFYKKNKKISLYKALLREEDNAINPVLPNILAPKRLELEYIESDISISIEKASKKNKLFVEDDKIILLLDQSNLYSQIVTLDLNSTNYKVDNIKKPFLSEYGLTESNSFISKNQLYQLAVSNKYMKFTVTDISSKKLIKKIHLAQKDSITFKNTPIIQEGGEFNNYREMEKTSKFLRKLSLGSVGVSVYHSNDSIQVMLGGIEHMHGMDGGFSQVVTVDLGSTGVTYTYVPPLLESYRSYAGSKSTYIKCLFDENWSHIPGEMPTNGFDKIEEIKKQILDENTETIFRFGDHLIYGYYYPKQRKYFLKKFDN